MSFTINHFKPINWINSFKCLSQITGSIKSQFGGTIEYAALPNFISSTKFVRNAWWPLLLSELINVWPICFRGPVEICINNKDPFVCGKIYSR